MALWPHVGSRPATCLMRLTSAETCRPYYSADFVVLAVSLFLYAGARRSEEGIEGVMYFAQDVTTRQQAEELSQVQVKMEAANKAKLEQLQLHAVHRYRR